MKWISIDNKPADGRETPVLLARFSGNTLLTITRGDWYPDDNGGFFAPYRDIKATHWMKYSDYWKHMEKLK